MVTPPIRRTLAALASLSCALAAAGCFETSYRCSLDSDCDVGALGRCEINHRCTISDETCPTQRRYTAHAEELSNQCFDDSIQLLNPCAGGQPPARPDGCLRDVCDAIPACCETGWSDACVQAAQQRCEVACDTRIAIAATAGSQPPTLIDLRWNGTAWTSVLRADLSGALAWLAPAPGTVEPRLAGLANGALVVGDREYALDAARDYQTLTSIDVDRDGRDTVALYATFDRMPVQHVIEIVKLDDGARRSLPGLRAQLLAWGDNDHDAFPDGVAAFNTTYSVLDNIETAEPSRVRSLAAATNANIANVLTPMAPPIRNLDWGDLDGDGRLDLAVFGTQVRLHRGDARLSDTPVMNRDCDPPTATNMTACPVPEDVAFAGAVLAAPEAPALAVATFPARKLYRLAIDPAAPQEPIVTQLPDACPTCPPLIALVARDLDRDRRLDLIGIDPRLRVYTALAADGYMLRASDPMAPVAQTFSTVKVSVSGAPIP